jgi:hypothetical protein
VRHFNEIDVCALNYHPIIKLTSKLQLIATQICKLSQCLEFPYLSKLIVTCFAHTYYLPNYPHLKKKMTQLLKGIAEQPPPFL